MLRRLYNAMVYALVAVFISMSTTGAVVASFSQPSPTQLALMAGVDHSGMANGHHDHEKAQASTETKRVCLAFCFEAFGEQNLGPAVPQVFQPKLVAVDWDFWLRPGFASQSHSLLSTNGARGPPGFSMATSSSGLSGLLLLNARLRI